MTFCQLLGSSTSIYPSFTFFSSLSIFYSFSSLPSPFNGVCWMSLPEQGVWAPGRLGAGACASEIHGVGHSSNVYVITATHYFHQSNFYSRQDHFHSEKICLLRSFCIDPASIEAGSIQKLLSKHIFSE